MGRDSILLRLMSRSANTLSDLNNAPGTFFTLKAMEVLFAPDGMIPLYTLIRDEPKRWFSTSPRFGETRVFSPTIFRSFRVKKKRVKLRLSSSMPCARMRPPYWLAAFFPAIPAASFRFPWMAIFIIKAKFAKANYTERQYSRHYSVQLGIADSFVRPMLRPR